MVGGRRREGGGGRLRIGRREGVSESSIDPRDVQV